MVAVQCHQDCRARGQPLDVTRDACHLDQIALAKRLLQTEKQAGKEIRFIREEGRS